MSPFGGPQNKRSLNRWVSSVSSTGVCDVYRGTYFFTKPVCWRGVVFGIFFLWEKNPPFLKFQWAIQRGKETSLPTIQLQGRLLAVTLGRGESFWVVCKPRIAKNLQQPRSQAERLCPKTIINFYEISFKTLLWTKYESKKTGRSTFNSLLPPLPAINIATHNTLATSPGKVVRRNPPTWGSWRRENGVTVRLHPSGHPIKTTPWKSIPPKINMSPKKVPFPPESRLPTSIF